MNLAFDHIVHLVNDPVQAASQLRDQGLHASAGGRHSNWGTYNSLCYFDLSYVEFLGIFDRSRAESETENLLVRDSAARLPAQEGFTRIALRTQDIEQTAAVLRERGLTVIGPFPGCRTRPDGKVIEWSMLFVRSDDVTKPDEAALPLPFFIQWGEGDDERRRDLEERGVIAPHALGKLTLKHVSFAVENLVTRVQEWSRWFGLKAGETFYDPHLNATCRTLLLPGGNLLFCSPTGDGVVANVLAAYGETPYALEAIGAEQNKLIQLCNATYTFTKDNR